jgi:hypothetical protein
MERILFKEEQKYDKWWFWLILLSASGLAVGPVWYGLFHQVTTGQPWGDDPSSNGALTLTASLTTLLMAGIMWLFKTIRLQVEITENEVRFRYLPLVRKWRSIKRTEIERYEIGKFKPIARYGGWGIRIGFRKHSRAYSTTGNIGLKLFLKNGKMIVIGTQRAQAISYAMGHLMARTIPDQT